MELLINVSAQVVNIFAQVAKIKLLINNGQDGIADQCICLSNQDGIALLATVKTELLINVAT